MAKVIFLHLSVIHSVHRDGGRGSASVHAGIPPPPRAGPAGTRHPPQPDPPSGSRHPPPGKQTPAYGLRAAGTHPTGMHSCFILCRSLHRPRSWSRAVWISPWTLYINKSTSISRVSHYGPIEHLCSQSGTYTTSIDHWPSFSSRYNLLTCLLA